ncbi:ankyrin repeat domain-containing protein [Candidatus Uabimicrobium amorphum]|uniref:Uncharacterized protein n=1 Tax=Uabimicrobium amorphum TaxID=2596890 RepID=A0A5S9F5I8_UABAM|nr:ankyrin repeat domain-containing protein [Candidatus Uabimicrobium amorphum]BBM86886.1 hypothetical protein UABAM_05288 [Candidatus Uabimicrobium amorphum]
MCEDFFAAIVAGDQEKVGEYFGENFDLNIRSSEKEIEGLTPLHVAIDTEQTELIIEFLKRGADPNRRDCEETSQNIRDAKWYSADTDYETINKMMNIRTGRTPLMYALGINNNDISKLLLENGADPNIEDFLGFNSLSIAVEKGNKEMVEKFLEMGVETDWNFWEENYLLSKKMRKFLEKKGIKKTKKKKEKKEFVIEETLDFSPIAADTLEKYTFENVLQKLHQNVQSEKFLEAKEHAESFFGKAFKKFSVERKWVGYFYRCPKKRNLTNEDLFRLQNELAKHNAFAYVCKRATSERQVRIIPEADKYYAIVLEQTWDCRLGTDGIVEFVMQIDRDNPVILDSIENDALSGEFINPINNPRHLAKKMQDLCPDLYESKMKLLAEELEENREFYLWWD